MQIQQRTIELVSYDTKMVARYTISPSLSLHSLLRTDLWSGVEFVDQARVEFNDIAIYMVGITGSISLSYIAHT